MASPVSSVGSSNTDTASASTALGGTAPSEEMFLQLLVAQLQNQDPLNPTDSTQFVTQLAQFSQLEQTMAIRSNTDTLVSDAAAAASSTSTNNNANNDGQTPATGSTKS